MIETRNAETLIMILRIDEKHRTKSHFLAKNASNENHKSCGTNFESPPTPYETAPLQNIRKNEP